MKKNLILLAILLSFSSFCFSQDIITKTNGDDIKAKVTEVTQFEVKYKRFGNLEGPLFTIQKVDILMIRYENGTKDIFNQDLETHVPLVQKTIATQTLAGSRMPIKRKTTIQKGNGLGKESGWWSDFELSYCIGGGDFAFDRLSFNGISSYQFNPYFSLGFGSGLRYYTDFYPEVLLLPVFADFRGYLLDNDITPYGEISIGYSADITEEGCSGFFFSPKIGGSYKVSEKLRLTASIGYEMQKMEVWWYYSTGGGYYDTENFGALCISLGVSF